MFPLELDLGPLLPEHLSELVIGLVLFLIIWVVMAKKVVPSFEEMYTKRRAQIEGGIEEAERRQAEADEALAKYRAQLASAKDEAAQLREAARQAAADIRNKARHDAEAEAARIEAAARAHAAAEKAQVAAELRSEIGGLATTLASKLLGEELSDDTKARATVDRFLAELESNPSGV